jgi:uncharacterized protein YcfJ
VQDQAVRLKLERSSPRAGQSLSGAQLLVSDTRTTLLLLNHARKQVVVRVFGVSPEDANVVSAIGLLVIADAAHKATTRVLKSPRAPTLEDELMAGASIRALVGAIAGPAIDETPGLGTLITIALVGRAVGPTAVRSIRALRGGTHGAAVHFHHRYGYLVDPGHWREQRAERREARERSAEPRPA